MILYYKAFYGIFFYHLETMELGNYK